MNLLLLFVAPLLAAAPSVDSLDYVDGNSAVKLYVTKGPRDAARTWFVAVSDKNGRQMPPIAVFAVPAEKNRPAYPGSVTLGTLTVDGKLPMAPLEWTLFNDGGRGLWAYMQRPEGGSRICLAPVLWWGISEAEAYRACLSGTLR